jgi:hypothetical protein
MSQAILEAALRCVEAGVYYDRNNLEKYGGIALAESYRAGVVIQNAITARQLPRWDWPRKKYSAIQANKFGHGKPRNRKDEYATPESVKAVHAIENRTPKPERPKRKKKDLGSHEILVLEAKERWARITTGTISGAPKCKPHDYKPGPQLSAIMTAQAKAARAAKERRNV